MALVAPGQTLWFPVLALTKAWSGAVQNSNVFVRSAASQRLASHKPAASQQLIGGQLIKFCLQNHFN